MRRSLARAYLLCFGAEDPVRLDFFYRCFSLSLLVYVIDRSGAAFEWLSHQGYHPSLRTEFLHLPPPLPLLPAWGVPIFLAVYLSAIVGLVLGWQVRKLAAIVLLCTIYVSFADTDAAYTMNKLYIVGYGLLLLRPRTQRVSVGGGERLRESAWVLRALQASVILHYFAAGVCKVLHGDWVVEGGLLAGGEVADVSLWFSRSHDVLWGQANGVYRTELAAWMIRELPVGVFTLLQNAALLFELLAPLLLTVRRLRPIGILWGVGFQVSIALTMYKIGLFNLQMMCFFLLFVEARRLEALCALPGRLLGRGKPAGAG